VFGPLTLAAWAALAIPSAPIQETEAAKPQKEVPSTWKAEVREASFKDRNNLPPAVPVSTSAQLASGTGGIQANLQDAWFGKLEIGKKEHLVLVGSSAEEAEHPDRLCIDLDGDGKIGESETLELEIQVRETPRGNYLMSKPVSGRLANGTRFQAGFSRLGKGKPRLSLSFPRYLHAEHGDMVIAVLDKDMDGSFGSEGDRWVLNKKGGRPTSMRGMPKMDENSFHDGKRFSIKVGKGEIAVATVAAEGPDPEQLAKVRGRVEHEWMEAFEKGRKQFVEQRKIDTSRPLAEKPIAWHYVSFDEAIEMGRKAGKPVFVDVMAYWCVWCYRLDWITYPDAEVAGLLNQDYIAVKIVQEERLQDYEKVRGLLKARGIPAMGVFDGEGKPLLTIGGWKPADAMAAELEKGKKAFQKASGKGN
jgi:thiol-disulfide isomerase/thioredoxin